MDSSLVINQCENGAIGLNMLKEQSDANYKIIVLLDINTSYWWLELLEQIEKSDFYNIHHLFIYIVSSSTDESDILKAQQYGFVKGFLHKPITSEDINRIIIDWHYSTVATCFVV
jgi:DNA-binding NarL/FixJ family response regulator